VPARKHDHGMTTPPGLSRDLLVPYVLLFLKNWSAHGYQILQTLTALGFAAVDPATVYRTLRQMEREGLVLSGWEAGAAGPARRTYQITASGEEFLKQWADALGAYQRFLDRFFSLYASGGEPPADPAAEASTSEAESIPPGRSTRNVRQRPRRPTSGE
jgi:PadR family transcriptional regulator PadR